MKLLCQITLLLCCFLVASMSYAQPAAEKSAIGAQMPKKHLSFFKKYCLDCHDNETQEGKIDLESISFDIKTLESAERWAKVLNSLNSAEMPPEDETQPTAADKTSFLEDLSAQLVVARNVLSDSGGVITMRRLNRREYINTMRDLLGVEVNADDLPDDASSGGFDTAGASLFFSSDQFEQYVKIARQSLDQAIVRGPEPQTKKFKIESEIASSKMINNRYNNLHNSHVRAEKWRKSDKKPTAFGFIDEARVAFEDGNYKKWGPTYKKYLDDPASETGALMYNWFQGAHIVPLTFNYKMPAGKYIVRVRAAALEGTPAQKRFLEFGRVSKGSQAGEIGVEGCYQVTGTLESPEIIEIAVTISSPESRSLGFRQKQHNTRNASRDAFVTSQRKTGLGPDPDLWIDWIEWEGPLLEQWPPESHQQIFFKGDETKKDDTYASEILASFAQRAFRDSQPSAGFLNSLLNIYRSHRALGKSFEEAIKEPLSIILASPSFLYISEPDSQPGKRSLTDLELAVRLSYFLWSSSPDDELIELANAGNLSDPSVLKQQTNRMLADPKAWEFISGFTHQWLNMERLDFFQFNYKLYPEFDESMKAAARNEVYHTIQTLLQEKRSIGELLKADYVVINDLLASYYEIENVTGSHFRKVKVPADSPRGGLLGTAAVLAMGSDGERSSPVERGAWVMRKLLHDPPPPAPANVPQLSRFSAKALSARELQAAHQEEPQCAQCHRKIDPLGFGLENFNAAGKWRENELTIASIPKKKNYRTKYIKVPKQLPIDASGTLPDGTAFADYFEMRDRVAERNDEFARGFTEALIAYGLGRQYGFSDRNLADKILKQTAQQDYQLKSFLHALVQSKQFQTK
ncbi:MAG: hypothetical protein COA78_36025 [Blastopirellula sp.]|nr:MAG: hypothetical protein COA78_36025 [Blastopirellula sp.]